ncbi:MAG: WG repeat-containing protein, partial [Bacteroidota bacterium]
MKTLIVVILVITVNILVAQNKNTPENKITISYSVNLNDYNFPQNGLYTSINYLSHSQKQKLFSGFVQKIQNGKNLKSYKLPYNASMLDFNNVSDKNLHLLNDEYVYDVSNADLTIDNGRIFSGKDLLIDVSNQNYLFRNSDVISMLNTVDFFETWEFDKSTGSFAKTVKQIGLTVNDERNDLFGFKTNDYNNSVVLERNKKIDTYEFSSTDVLIGKISYYVDFKYFYNDVINPVSQINNSTRSFYHYIQPDKRYKLITDILEYIYTEQIVNNNQIVFDYADCSYPLSNDLIHEKISWRDTFFVEDPETYELIGKVCWGEKNLRDITGLVFYETWYYDSKNFSMRKIVHGISLVEKKSRDYYDGDENEYELHQLFYIQMKNANNKKCSPFYTKNVNFLSENLYSDGYNIYRTDGTVLTKELFQNQFKGDSGESYKNEIYSYFYDDLILAGIVTGIDTFWVENVWDGNLEITTYPRYLYGLINKQGKVVIPFTYNNIGEFIDGLAVVSADSLSETENHYGVINEKGVEVIPCKYNELQILNNKLIKVTDGDKSGIISSSGKQILEMEYDEICPFTSGNAKIEKDGKWGLVNSEGKVLLECNNYYISNFKNGKALVYNNATPYYIDIQGKIIGNAEYKKNSYTSDGKVIISIGEINEKGKIITDAYFGLSNMSGNIILKCNYSNIRDISDKLLAVENPSLDWSILDKNGQKVNSNAYYTIGDFLNGVSKVSVRSSEEYDEYGYPYVKYGYIDETGREIIPVKYDNVSVLFKNIYLVSNAGKYGLID